MYAIGLLMKRVVLCDIKSLEGVYEGDLVDNIREGEGTITWPCGHVLHTELPFLSEYVPITHG